MQEGSGAAGAAAWAPHTATRQRWAPLPSPPLPSLPLSQPALLPLSPRRPSSCAFPRWCTRGARPRRCATRGASPSRWRGGGGGGGAGGRGSGARAQAPVPACVEGGGLCRQGVWGKGRAPQLRVCAALASAAAAVAPTFSPASGWVVHDTTAHRLPSLLTLALPHPNAVLHARGQLRHGAAPATPAHGRTPIRHHTTQPHPLHTTTGTTTITRPPHERHHHHTITPSHAITPSHDHLTSTRARLTAPLRAVGQPCRRQPRVAAHGLQHIHTGPSQCRAPTRVEPGGPETLWAAPLLAPTPTTPTHHRWATTCPSSSSATA